MNQHLEQLEDLPARVVIGTSRQWRYNDAFCWTAESGLRSVHRKTFLPRRAGFWEATWYERGPVEFQAFDTPVGRIGVSVCTEMVHPAQLPSTWTWSLCRGRRLRKRARSGWSGGATHAVTSGAFCVSSNRANPSRARPWVPWAGSSTSDGAVLARTTDAEPVAIRDIELTEARVAKRTYPRYVARD
ncbi:MAG: hypothetical protein M9886_12010 [Candidatus Nanopelagicales bacterium]|nr:hypothetical protein [Candidatus Nanopelagicales bacterium]